MDAAWRSQAALKSGVHWDATSAKLSHSSVRLSGRHSSFCCWWFPQRPLSYNIFQISVLEFYPLVSELWKPAGTATPSSSSTHHSLAGTLLSPVIFQALGLLLGILSLIAVFRFPNLLTLHPPVGWASKTSQASPPPDLPCSPAVPAIWQWSPVLFQAPEKYNTRPRSQIDLPSYAV